MVIEPLENQEQKDTRLFNEALDKAKNEAIAKINPHREDLLNKDFPFLDKMIQSNEVSKINLMGYLSNVEHITFPLAWRVADDTTLSISNVEQLKEMSLLMLGFIQTVMTSSWEAKDNIKSSTTIELIDTIISEYLGV